MLLNKILTLLSIATYPIVFDFLIRLTINLVTTFILVRYIFYPHNGQKALIFTFVIIGLVIFMIASVLNRVKIEFSMAIGLFAVFSIIRYRTPPFEIKEMTYLLAIIGISIINALVDPQMNDWIAFATANLLLVGISFSLEKYTPKKNISKKLFIFSVAEMQILSNNQKLINEIKNQTGLNIFKAEIDKINAAKNEISVWIYFR